MIANEYGAIVAEKRFRTRRIDAGNKAASAALVNAQNELAFRKRRLRDRGFEPPSDPTVALCRREVVALRQRLDV